MSSSSVPGFSRADRIAFAVLPSVAAVLSIAGASLIVYMVASRKRNSSSSHNQQRPTYHRLLLAMSVCTIIQAISSAVGPLAVPEWVGGYGGKGNTVSCSAQGFFAQFVLGELIYNAGLSIYFVAVIRYNPTNVVIAHRLEPMIHFWAIAESVIFGISGLVLTVFNPQFVPELGCWYSPYPVSCYYAIETCERGRYFQEIAWVFYSQQCFFVAIVIVMSAVLYCTVRGQHRSMNRYASRESIRMQEKSREVAHQALFFAAACLCVNIWPIIATALFKFDTTPLLAKIILYITSFATPSQGFFNFLIYVRPRYVRMRRRQPGVGRLRALIDVIRGESSDNGGGRAQSIRFVAAQKRESVIALRAPVLADTVRDLNTVASSAANRECAGSIAEGDATTCSLNDQQLESYLRSSPMA